MVSKESCVVEFWASNDIASAGQTLSQGLEQSRGQSSGSNSVFKDGNQFGKTFVPKKKINSVRLKKIVGNWDESKKALCSWQLRHQSLRLKITKLYWYIKLQDKSTSGLEFYPKT